jgi:hypothetical protein
MCFVLVSYTQQIAFMGKSEIVDNFTYFTYNQSLLRYDTISIQSTKEKRYDFVNTHTGHLDVFDYDSISNIYFQKISYNNENYYILFITTNRSYVGEENKYRTHYDSYSCSINGKSYYGTIEYGSIDKVPVSYSYDVVKFHIFNENDYFKLFSDKKQIIIRINYAENEMDFLNYEKYSLDEKIISRINYKIYGNYFIIKKEKNIIKFLLPSYEIGNTEIRKNIIDKHFYKMTLNDFNKLKIK